MKLLCWAISSPRSQVSERRNVAGSWRTCWLRAATTVAVSLPDTFTSMTEARMTLHQRGHVAVARPAQQIALPMAGNGTIFDFRRSFADGNGIDDLALRVSVNAGVPRAADPPLGAKVLNQLLFQRSARLNEQAAINRFVRHAQALVVRDTDCFSHPEICSGDQSSISLLATMVAELLVQGQTGRPWAAKPTARPADRLHWLDTARARHGGRPLGLLWSKRDSDVGR